MLVSRANIPIVHATGQASGMEEITLVTSQVLGGLLAGLYAAFAIAIMPALRGATDVVFAEVMNRINVAIVNPLFLLLFLGAPITAAAMLVWQRGPLVVVAAALAVAALLITAVLNIPLNNALADGGPRSAFENAWTTWHAVRTVACVASFALLSVVGTRA